MASAEPTRLVGAAGIEPATICSQSRYATAALRPVARIILRRKEGSGPVVPDRAATISLQFSVPLRRGSEFDRKPKPITDN